MTASARRWSALCMALIVAFAVSPVSPLAASVQIDLYRIELPAQSQSSAERQRLIRRGLTGLFVRLTGDDQAVARYPQLRSSLDQAPRYLASFNYFDREEPAGLRGDPGQPVDLAEQSYIELVFNGEAVNQLLSRAGAPLWGAVRPELLVWLVEQTRDQRAVVNPETQPLRSQQLEQSAKRRGIPLIQPLLDLEERSRIDAEALWQRDWPTISRASQRYQPAAILVGKLGRGSTASSLGAQPNSGRWLGQWQLLHRGQTFSASYQGEDIDAFFARGLALAASQFASEYAVQGQGAGLQTRRVIRVSGVESQADYVALSGLLNRASALNAVQLQRIEGNQCWFSFESSAQRQQLDSLLTLDARLRRGSFAGSELHYSWHSSE